jgi:hypothetical protein
MLINDEMLLVVIYVNDMADAEARAAMQKLCKFLAEGMRIELKPIVANRGESLEYDLICVTGLSVQGEHIVLDVSDAEQFFAISITVEEGDDEAEELAYELLNLFDYGRLKFGHFLLHEDYPFDPETDVPEEVFVDRNKMRDNCIIPYKVIFAGNRFWLDPEEEAEDAETDDSTTSEGDDIC